MQVIVSIMSNAGGVGKTNLAVHLAYELAQSKLSVCLIDLDPQRGLDLPCGLNHVDADHSVVKVFRKDFDGSWPLTIPWLQGKSRETAEKIALVLLSRVSRSLDRAY
jgi:chromosome partitioning protein